MNIVSVFRAKPQVREGWQRTTSYLRTPQQTTDYRARWHEFVRHFTRLHEVAASLGIEVKKALIVGPGSEPMEAGLLLGAFTDMAELHLADWHEPNVDKLEETLTQWAEQQPQYGRARLHLSDAVNLEAISDRSLDLAYMHQVIEGIEGYDGYYPQVIPQKVLDIFRLGIRRVLVPGGLVFTLGTQITPALRNALVSTGFERIQDDIWRRVA